MAKYMTMTEMALESLRKLILQGELKPGTQLVPAKLEGILSLSREAIRDAIRQIVGYGLAGTITNKGTYVEQPLALEELKEIYELRSHAEPKIVVTALKNYTEQQIKELEQLCDQMESLTESTEFFADHFMLNREFHLNLYRPAGWNHLHRNIALWLDQVLIFRSCLCHRKMYKDIANFNQDHRQILSVIRSGDSEELKRLVEANVWSGFENILRNYSEELQEEIDAIRPNK